MTKEEFGQLKSTVKQWLFHTGALDSTNYANELKSKFIEPREKRIEELTKEAESLIALKVDKDKRIEELEQKLEQTEKDLADYQFNYPSIKKLSEENAELKVQKEKMKCCGNCVFQGECDLGGYKECKNFDKWEIKENE